MRSPLIIHRCLIVLSLFKVVLSSTCFLKAECRTNATGIFNKTCTVLCPPSCLKSSFPIWGAGRYSVQSSVCRAAIHDVRLNASAETSFNVTIRKNLAELVTFHSLVRNEITSFGLKATMAESFIFINPRLSELVEDITILHKLNGKNSQIPSIECYHRGNKTKRLLQMGVITSGLMTSNKPRETIGTIGQGFRIRYLMSLSSEPDKKYGIIYCTPQNSLSMWSFVTSSILNSQSQFHPPQYSLTLNVGDNTNIAMRNNNISKELRPVWFKDNYLLQSYYSDLTYSDVQIGHTGFYSVDYVHRRNIHKGTIKIIVRDCKTGRYGPYCSKTCPPCQNGGICHDITGQCICPPGFRGVLCEIGCGPNRFGQNCDASCVDLDGEEGCKGILLCLPDPFGCSCAAGFEGLNCSKKCQTNHYGAGCKEVCSIQCKPQFSCDSFTGKCHNGCNNGWKGDTCKISSPVHSVPPNVKFIDPSTLAVSWRPWKYGSDIGGGHVDNYRVEYTEESLPDIWQIHQVSRENFDCNLNITSNSKIKVRIRIQENGIWHESASPIREVIRPVEEGKKEEGSQSSTVAIIVGCILVCILICIIAIGIYFKRRYKKTNDGNKGNDNANAKNTESVPLMEKQPS